MNVDMSLLLLLGIAALGIISKNQTIAIAMLVLALLRLTNQHKVFLYLEKFGITIGVVVLTIGVMTPIASGKIGVPELGASFLNWRSLAAIAVGALVAYLGGRGVKLMAAEPLIVNGLLMGTILGVAFLRGVPVGPLIAAGILSALLGRN